MSERRRNTHENTRQEPTRSKHVIDNPLSIDRDEDSIKLTGSTAASDMKFYFDQIKKQNTE
ncbi:MAG: hypothetical protein GX136_07575 [Clostridiales bacterium]|jgi:hypothetical protein|nr:hypothetical protein [Clostridiales bacterium]